MAKRPIITVSKTSIITDSSCSRRSAMRSSSRRNMESNTKVRNANIVKIMFVFFVETYPMIADYYKKCAESDCCNMKNFMCSHLGSHSLHQRKMDQVLLMVVIKPITVMRYTLFCKIAGTYICRTVENIQ